MFASYHKHHLENDSVLTGFLASWFQTAEDEQDVPVVSEIQL
jgi:hypothetical protein